LKATVPAERIMLELEGQAVALWRPTQLERFVDVRGLLCDEAAPEPPYWMHLWPGAVAAARLVAQSERVGPGTRLLELGCGLGLPALIAAARGAAVVATDRERVALDFARRSAIANGRAVELVQMDWGAVALRGQFDVCVGADIGYDAGAEAALVDGVASLVAPGGVIWLADSVNTARDGLTRHLASRGFSIAVETMREWEDGHAVWVRVITARRRARIAA
jgi:predicted nicotinamide N-methyase